MAEKMSRSGAIDEAAKRWGSKNRIPLVKRRKGASVERGKEFWVGYQEWALGMGYQDVGIAEGSSWEDAFAKVDRYTRKEPTNAG